MSASTATDDSLLTRESLLSRLREWNNGPEWREFFDTYWRLIFNFGRKSGLGEQDAQDLVQEVMLSVAKKLPAFTYDRSKGRFRNWLLLVVRSRLMDHWRKHLPKQQRTVSSEDEAVVESAVEPEVERLWDDEWRAHLLGGAFSRLRRRVPARHFMLFEMSARQGMPLGKVAASLGIGLTHAYVIRHRLHKMLREEVERTENGGL
jgi:RNA polymerase sigma factor (sigma-70 family)